MLVSAFAGRGPSAGSGRDPTAGSGRGLVLRAYQQAFEEKYRFYSFGDAMMIV